MDELLNGIKQAALCSFLSDLHADDFALNEYAKEQIMQIPDSRYTLEQWCATAIYVTGKPCHAESVQRAKESICQIESEVVLCVKKNGSCALFAKAKLARWLERIENLKTSRSSAPSASIKQLLVSTNLI